jgi:hypothetical protein
MAGDFPDFNQLIIEAHRVTAALDDLTLRNGSKATVAAVGDGRRTYRRLLDYQRTARMTRHEAHALDEATDMLRARLKFFGESV